MRNKPVTYSKEDQVGIVAIDSPPVNAVSQQVRQGLMEAFAQAADDREAQAIVLLCKGRTFIAGADIKEFDAPELDPKLRQVIQQIESTPKLVVAALHGTALGGGLEVAMGCHYRCALPSAKMGLPEVHLGIIPGAGGSQRLPRAVGARQALELIVEGRIIDAQTAHQMGLVDQIAPGDLRQSALDYARSLAVQGAPLRRLSDEAVDTEGFDEALIEACLARAGKRMRGQKAPQRAVAAVRAAVQLPFAQGQSEEARLVEAAVQTDEAKSLVHLFLAEREVSRIPGIAKDLSPIRKVGVLGAGTMGGGIAMALANSGFPVTLVETGQEQLQRGLETIRANYQRSMAKGRLGESDFEQRMGLIGGSLVVEDLGSADLVVEAVYEDLGLKKEVFRQLDAICKPGAILATNTSTLDLNEIASATSRPESVLGLHFFSPAQVMRLVEIVRGSKTSDAALASSVDLVKRLGKVGVVVGVCFGFVGNRMMLEGYMREADQMLLEGATPAQLDRVLYDFGFAMGPCAVNDLAGLDVGYRIRQTTGAAQKYPPPYHVVIDALAEMGRHGQKSGKGFYRYQPGDRTPRHDPEVDSVIEREARRLGIERGRLADGEILKRCLYSLINEGAKVLEEGIALRPGDVDVIWTSGYGFPRYRGGPLFYADTVGLAEVYQDVCRYQQRFGDYWKPAPLLEQLAKAGKTFAGWSGGIGEGSQAPSGQRK